jgi:nucleoside-diphosphate-sugar epimerase
MKILITGATGLFGSYLARKFAMHHEVFCLKREGQGYGLLEDYFGQVHWREGDVLDPISIEEAIEDMDVVIHAAGKVSFHPKDSEDLNKVNVEGTTNVVNAMLGKGVGKLIHVSSVSALGRTAEGKTCNEETAWVESNLNTPYAVSKYQAELEVWRGAMEGLQVMVLLPSVILGKLSDARSSTQVYEYVLEGSRYFPPGSINYIDIRDAVDITYALFEKGLWGEKFILNTESIPYRDFFVKMAEAAGKKPPTKPVNDFQLSLAIWALGIARALGLSKNPLNKQTAMLSKLDITMRNDKVQRILGPTYQPLAETFRWAFSNEKR